MKKLLVCTAIAMLGQQSLAQSTGKLQLVCTGWVPVYLDFDRGAENRAKGDEADKVVVEIDKSKRAIRFASQAGPVTALLSETEQFYSGSDPEKRRALGKTISAINVSINRLTGDGYASYQFEGESGGKVIFSGKCAPGKPLF